MYVYLQTEPQLFTVGHYDPKGKWIPESDFNDREQAADRVSFLNGNPLPAEIKKITDFFQEMQNEAKD